MLEGPTGSRSVPLEVPEPEIRVIQLGHMRGGKDRFVDIEEKAEEESGGSRSVWAGFPLIFQVCTEGRRGGQRTDQLQLQGNVAVFVALYFLCFASIFLYVLGGFFSVAF